MRGGPHPAQAHAEPGDLKRPGIDVRRSTGRPMLPAGAADGGGLGGGRSSVEHLVAGRLDVRRLVHALAQAESSWYMRRRARL